MKKYIMVLIGCLSGCALTPNLPDVKAPIPKQWSSGDMVVLDTLNWSTVYDQSFLKEAINKISNENLSIQLAELKAKRAFKLISTVQPYLTLNVGLEGEYSGPIESCCVYSSSTFGYIGSQLSIDIWNKIGSAKESAISNSKEKALDIDTIKNALIAEVIRSYTIIGFSNSYLKEIDKLNRILDKMEKVLHNRVSLGFSDSVDLLRIQNKKNDLKELKINIQQKKNNSIKTLEAIFSYTTNIDTFIELSDIVSKYYSIPETISTRVLLNRPDVKSAYQSIITSNEIIGITKANQYPDILLPIDLLFFTSGKKLWEIIPTISMTIFDSGRLKAETDIAFYDRDIKVKEYEIIVQNAYKDVAVNFTNVNATQEQVKVSKQSFDIVKTAYDKSVVRSKEGLDSFSSVIDRYDDLKTFSLQKVEHQLLYQLAMVSLFESIGVNLD